MSDWYEATGAKRWGRNHSLLIPAKPKTNILRPQEDDPYYCKIHGDRKHWPVYGSYARPGERLMRADNCVYCGERIVSLHTGYEWDNWRTVASVRPATIIEELPF